MCLLSILIYYSNIENHNKTKSPINKLVINICIYIDISIDRQFIYIH